MELRKSLRHWHRYEPENLRFEVGLLATPASARPLLVQLLATLTPSDELTVDEIWAFGASISDIASTISRLAELQVQVFCRKVSFYDLTSYHHREVFQTLKDLRRLAEMQKAERIRGALQATRIGGEPLGRPRNIAFEDPRAVADVLRRVAARESVSSIARFYGVHRRTVDRLVVREVDDSIGPVEVEK